MTFKQFVIRNTLRNKRLYLAYFLSTLFAVIVFFTFAVFGYHPTLTEGMNGKVTIAMNVSSGIIYVFAFFFVLYSMGVFLQSRKKEFGLLMMQGLSPKQLKKMVFIENILMGLLAVIVGIIFGTLFSGLILGIAGWLLEIHLAFYFPKEAIIITLIAFIILFLFISVFITIRLPRFTLKSLLSSEQAGKGEIKVSKIKSILAIVLLAGGYITALLAKGVMVFMVMIPVIIVVILGTYFFFEQLSIRVIQTLRKRKSFFWKKTNIVLFSDLAFRMKDNARSFFWVAIISTVAFSAIGTLFGFSGMVTEQMDKEPYDFSLVGQEKEIKEPIKVIEQELQKGQVKTEKLTATYKKIQKGQQELNVLSVTSYNRFAKMLQEKPVDLNKGIAVAYPGFWNADMKSKKKIDGQVSLSTGGQREVTQTIDDPVLNSGAPILIIPDELFEQVKSTGPVQSEVVWQIAHTSKKTKEKIGQAINKRLGEEGDFSFTPKEAMKSDMLKGYRPVLFVGLFIGLVFFVAAGSFLYFRLYSDLETDKQKFQMIQKIGLSLKELNKILSKQVAILFFVPIAVSLVHGFVALTAMYHMFDRPMGLDAVIVLLVFLGIQVVYYCFARYNYVRQIKKALV